jgi:hypothetical protein
MLKHGIKDKAALQQHMRDLLPQRTAGMLLMDLIASAHLHATCAGASGRCERQHQQQVQRCGMCPAVDQCTGGRLGQGLMMDGSYITATVAAMSTVDMSAGGCGSACSEEATVEGQAANSAGHP